MVPGKAPARRLLAASAAAALALGSVTLASRDAHALGGEVGAHGGPLLRSNTELGKTYGAFAGIRPTNQLGLYIDIFYAHQEFELTQRTPEGGRRFPDIDVFGGRVRYLIDATTRLKPYAHLGLAYAHISYPGLLTPISADISSGQPQGVIQRSGSFAELPVGLGLAIEVGKALRFNVEGAYRAGFAFSGNAYQDGVLPAEKKISSGGSLTLGVSLFF